MSKPFYILSNKDTLFIVIRDLKFKEDELVDKIGKGSNKEKLTFVFDLEILSKSLDVEGNGNKIFREIIYENRFINKDEKSNQIKADDNTHLNLVIKNCLVSKGKNLYYDDKDLKLNELIISDELYSMSPYIDILFQKFTAKSLTLKKFKINSKLQLNKFLNFIINTGCEELTLDDIFIELIIKKNQSDEEFNILEEYIFFENGIIYIKINNKKKETKIKKLIMIDCPLFAIKKNTFNNINNYKDITIDIDESSLLNPTIITKFKIEKGQTDVCFDLDSYKLMEDKAKDYLYYIDYIFKLIIDDSDNYNYHKIIFKNFDTTKYEYITGENLTFIEEKNWVLNKKEKERKKYFEEKEKDINNKISQNSIKLSVKMLTFDNCSNHFIKLVLKLVSKKKELELDYLKIKKCGKEYFDLSNILSFHIKHLILFDTPLIIGPFQKDKNTRLECYKGNFRRVDYLTIKISSLEHYCVSNNLDYYRTIEIIVELITHQNFNKNLCFEMNALPVIMTFLIAREYNKKSNINIIPTYFDFSDSNKRKDLIKTTFKLGQTFKPESITLRKNNIKNRYYNYENQRKIPEEIYEKKKALSEKTDFGSDLFNLDEDYKAFFDLNDIKEIIVKNCLFTNFIIQYKKEKQEKQEKEEKQENKIIIDKFETIINFMEENRSYIIDMKTLNEIIYKNKSMTDVTDWLIYLSKNLKPSSEMAVGSETINNVNNIKEYAIEIKKIFDFFKNKKITIKFENIKERKEFYCLLLILEVIYEKNTQKVVYAEDTKEKHPRKIELFVPNQSQIIKNIKGYFLQEKNEYNQDISSIFNYYYTSDKEKEIFGDYGQEKKEINFKDLKFSIKYDYDTSDPWKIIYQ